MEIWDTPGQEGYDRVCLPYDDADVVLCCYGVDSQTSLSNISAKWYPEIRENCPEATVILVGTKLDLRYDPEQPKLVDIADANKLKNKLGIKTLVECSAKTRENVKSVFDEAILAVLKPRKGGGCIIF